MSFEFQDAGADFLADGGVLLADSPGLGKTKQALMAAKALGARTILVQCPAIAVGVWQTEVAKWRPDLTAMSAQQDLMKPDRLPYTDRVLIMSYDHLVASSSLRGRIVRLAPFDLLILDEGHAVRNPQAKRTIYTYGPLSAGGSGSLISMCKRTIILTGTPQLNGAHELFVHLRALAPERIAQASYEAFVDHYCHRGVRTVRTKARAGQPSRTIEIPTITGTNRARAPELASRLRGFWLRRTTEQVMAELPPLRVEVRRLPIEMLDADLLAEAEDSDEAMELSAAVASGDPERLRDLEGPWARLRKLLAMAKVDATVQWAAGALDAGEPKVAVWGWHVEALKRVRDALAKADTHPIMIVGATTGRDVLVDRFQTDPACKAGVFQIQAAGTALTMTACKRAIFLEQALTPAMNHQAIKRHHRIGTTNPVLAEILVAPGLDEIVGEILARKSVDIAAVEGET